MSKSKPNPKGVEGVGQTAREWLQQHNIVGGKIISAGSGKDNGNDWKLTRVMEAYNAAQTLTLRAELQQEAEQDLARAMYAIAGWFGCADESKSRTPDELGQFLYMQQRQITDDFGKMCREGWQARAERAEAEIQEAAEIAEHWPTLSQVGKEIAVVLRAKLRTTNG